MISEDVDRIKIGDQIFIWSEQSNMTYEPYTNLVIVKHEKYFRIVPLGAYSFSNMQKMKKSLVLTKGNHRVLDDIDYSGSDEWQNAQERYCDHWNISKNFISWYEIELTMNIE